MESPLRREAHGGFGERSGETGREQSRYRAPGLLSDIKRLDLSDGLIREWSPAGRAAANPGRASSVRGVAEGEGLGGWLEADLVAEGL